MIIGLDHHTAYLFQQVLCGDSLREFRPQRHRIHTVPDHIFELDTTPAGHHRSDYDIRLLCVAMEPCHKDRIQHHERGHTLLSAE